MLKPIITLKDIAVSFDGEQVLKNFNLTIGDGEFVTLLGPSGCGKTTVLRTIGGFVTPDSGDVFFGGEKINDVPPHKRAVNTIFQKYALFPHLNVYENIAFGMRLKGKKEDEIQKTVTEMLHMVNLNGMARRGVGQLSGGQQQRVAIARALANEPKVLLLDEPLSALDLKLRKDMQSELKKIQQAIGITFIFVTHDQEEALNMSDRIAVMRNGLFEQLGTPNEIYDRPKTAYVARFVGSANILTLGGKCLAVRSEALELNRGESGRLTGVIREKTFSGGMLRITVDTESCGELVASRHGIDSPLAPGETVGISWAEGAAVEVEP